METTVEIDKKNYGRRSGAEFLSGGEQMWGILQFLTEQKHLTFTKQSTPLRSTQDC